MDLIKDLKRLRGNPQKGLGVTTVKWLLTIPLGASTYSLKKLPKVGIQIETLQYAGILPSKKEKKIPSTFTKNQQW